MKILRPQAQAWKEESIILTNAWRNKQKWRTTQKKKIIVRLWYFFPNDKKRDTHNTLKILMDTLEDGLIYDNDRYALPHVMDFETDRDNPRLEIEFEVKGA